MSVIFLFVWLRRLRSARCERPRLLLSPFWDLSIAVIPYRGCRSIWREKIYHPSAQHVSDATSAFADRITDAKSKWVITSDEGKRGGRTIPLKDTTDKAVHQ